VMPEPDFDARELSETQDIIGSPGRLPDYELTRIRRRFRDIFAPRTPAPAPMGETPETDEHGQLMGVMYRIPFNGLDAYFYTEKNYRKLERERDELRKERDQAQAMNEYHMKELTEAITSGDKLESERDKALADLSALRENADAMAAALKFYADSESHKREFYDGGKHGIDASWKPSAAMNDAGKQATAALTAYTGKEAK